MGVPVGRRVGVSVGAGGLTRTLCVVMTAVWVGGKIGVVVPLPVHAANTTTVKIKLTDKFSILIVYLIFQLHLPNGFQERPAFFEARFPQIT